MAVALSSALAFGCSHKIGDSCHYSTDCSAMGDRICDTTQPDGYCTMYPCEPNTVCPADEAACVAFADPSCPNLPSSRRFVRYFCLATCSHDGDCRGGYKCQDMGANVVDLNPKKRSVCVPRTDLSSSTTDAGSNAVCEPIDAAIFEGLLSSSSSTSPDSDSAPEASASPDSASEASSSGPPDSASEASDSSSTSPDAASEASDSSSTSPDSASEASDSASFASPDAAEASSGEGGI